jgi:uncharacterized alpha-E superfamily protein
MSRAAEDGPDRGTGLILSSTAQRCYWLGRYLERAESTARLIMVNGRLLYDLPKRLPLGWQGLVDITGSQKLFAEHYDEPSERNVARHLINDVRYPGSLFCSVEAAKENVRTLRGIIPRKNVEYINDLHLFVRENLSEPLSRTRRVQGLSEVQSAIERIEGFMSANMLHDGHWSFLRLGNFLERADMTSRILEAGCNDPLDEASDLEPFSDIQWRNVLLSLDATQSYNQIVQGPVSQEAVLDFLAHNARLPRSLAYPLDSLRNNVRNLPRCDRVLRAVNRLRRQVAGTDIGTFEIDEVRVFVDEFQKQLAEIHGLITRTYFVFKPRRRRSGK